MNPHDNAAIQAEFDNGITVRLAGVIVVSLVGLFILQRLGFRFVASAKVAP